MAADPIDNARVQGILDHARDLARAAKPSATGAEEAYLAWQILLTLRRWDDTPATPLSRVEGDPAWKSLLELPGKRLDQNYNLMAAEHYEYARYIAAIYGDPHTEGVLRTYFAAKTAVNLLPGGERRLRTSPQHPVLDESPQSKMWVSKGVAQGLLDYKAEHGGKLGTPYSSRGVVTGNAPAQYKRATGVPLPYASGAGA